jgi:hypothetical protein
MKSGYYADVEYKLKQREMTQPHPLLYSKTKKELIEQITNFKKNCNLAWNPIVNATFRVIEIKIPEI